MVCPNCGEEVDNKKVFCNNCGKRIFVNPITNEVSSANNSLNTSNYTDEGMQDNMVRNFLGDEFGSFRYGGFSFWAFFFGPLYFFYRKVYLPGLIIMILSMVSDYICVSIIKDNGLAIIASLFFCALSGVSFKQIYLSNIMSGKITGSKTNGFFGFLMCAIVALVIVFAVFVFVSYLMKTA